MEIPITIAKHEFDEKVSRLINEEIKNGIIPGFAMVQTFENALEFLRRYSDTQLKKDMETYYKEKEG